MYAWCVGRCTKMMGFLFLFRSITTRINHHNAHPFQSHPFHFFCSTIEKISFHVFISFSFTFHLASYRTKKIKISFYNYYFKIQYVCMHTYHACVRIYIYIYIRKLAKCRPACKSTFWPWPTGKVSTTFEWSTLCRLATLPGENQVCTLPKKFPVDALPEKYSLHFAEKIFSRHFAGKIPVVTLAVVTLARSPWKVEMSNVTYNIYM